MMADDSACDNQLASMSSEDINEDTVDNMGVASADT